MWVSDLMVQDPMAWNLDLIDFVFSPNEANIIKSIPLSSFLQDNHVVWGGEHLSLYSVYSGY